MGILKPTISFSSKFLMDQIVDEFHMQLNSNIKQPATNAVQSLQWLGKLVKHLLVVIEGPLCNGIAWRWQDMKLNQ